MMGAPSFPRPPAAQKQKHVVYQPSLFYRDEMMSPLDALNFLVSLSWSKLIFWIDVYFESGLKKITKAFDVCEEYMFYTSDFYSLSDCRTSSGHVFYQLLLVLVVWLAAGWCSGQYCCFTTPVWVWLPVKTFLWEVFMGCLPRSTTLGQNKFFCTQIQNCCFYFEGLYFSLHFPNSSFCTIFFLLAIDYNLWHFRT